MNKKQFYIFFIFIFIIGILYFTTSCEYTPLDEILNYEITVDVRNDGTLDIKYHIDWKVLNDSTEGPLEWVKIGIPNKHVDTIKALSDNIRLIMYYRDGGDYVRIDFDREYHKDEIVSFDFSIHQSNMYTLDYGKNECKFVFTPGWFDKIEVKKITLRWEAAHVKYSNAHGRNGKYLEWRDYLEMGEKMHAEVVYEMGVLKTSDEGQSNVEKHDDGNIVLVVLTILIAPIFILWLLARNFRGRGYRRGFGRGGRYGGFFGSHHSCASSCACACACACAGGGRAGCSAKNFYSVRIEKDTLKKVL